MLLMPGRTGFLTQCAWCRCLIVPPEDPTETELCARCSVGFEQHPIWEDDCPDRIVDLQKLDQYDDSYGPSCRDASTVGSPRSTVADSEAGGLFPSLLPREQPDHVLYKNIQQCIVEVPNRTAMPVESELWLTIHLNPYLSAAWVKSTSEDKSISKCESKS